LSKLHICTTAAQGDRRQDWTIATTKYNDLSLVVSFASP